MRIKDKYERDIAVEKIVRHEKYNPNNIDNDIAVFKLEEKLDFEGKDNMYRKICLAPEDSDYEGKTCWATGWGHTGYRKSFFFHIIL
jgi:hypothetical protein